MNNESDHLSHHGIFGQRWGHRNGPPYPLSFSKHSVAEKNNNPKSLLDNDNKPRKNIKKKKKKSNPGAISMAKKLSDEQLKSRTDRLKAEKQFIELSSRDITQGKDYAQSLLVTFGTTSVNSFVKTFGASIGAKAGTNLAKLIFGEMSFTEKKATEKFIEETSKDLTETVKELRSETGEIKEMYDDLKESGKTEAKRTYSGTVEDAPKKEWTNNSSQNRNSETINGTYRSVYPEIEDRSMTTVVDVRKRKRGN